MSAKFYASAVNPKTVVTPQTEAIPGRESEMVANSAGGVVFALDEWSYLDRFLILGSEKNSYYASAQSLTVKAAANVMKLIEQDAVRVVNRIVEISDAGRAPKNDSAIFALALVAVYANQEGRQLAYQALPKVCRIGTHLFQFVEVLNQLGKWNSLAKKGIANWYNAKSLDSVTYQILKYQNRNGWRHRDVLRLAHVKPDGVQRSSVYGWAAQAKPALGKALELPEILVAYDELHSNPSIDKALDYIEKFNLTWEMLPTSVLKSTDIWTALIPSMGYTALIRNLGRMGSLGMFKPLSDASGLVIDRLSNTQLLGKSRVHPVSILSALKTYSQGRGDRGSLVWDVNARIKEALNDAFYEAFGNVEPTGKKILMGIDCSGSMFGANVCGLNNLTAAEAAAVMAMAIVRKETNYWIGGFGHQMIGELPISPKMQLDQVMATIRQFNWGGTDVSLPAVFATKQKMDVDLFCTITDNETYAGRIQPTQALRDYRKVMNKPNARQVVCGTSVTNFTVADPKDPLQMDLAGFDANIPGLIASFVLGQF